MKAIILNSGVGTRMGVLTSEQPKCMTDISPFETIVSRQLSLLVDSGIKEVIMTTGKFDTVLVDYCQSLNLPLNIQFVKNPEYSKTNYIYSIYCAKKYLDDDIILMHGDLVFEKEVLDRAIKSEYSCMAVSTTRPLPEKDFKAVIYNDIIQKVGISFFDDAVAAQPLYKLLKNDWLKWLNKIIEYCETERRNVYAENALNELNGAANIHTLDCCDMLCGEVDDAEDLALIMDQLKRIENEKE